MQSRRMRHALAVGFLITATLVSGFYSFFIDPPQLLTNNDGAVQWEARMRPVRERLPGAVREVGYISDAENLGSLVEEFVLTKYALIPVVVRHGAGYEWVIGNFTEPNVQDLLNAQIPGRYNLEKFGAGIYLIHRSLP